MSKPTPDELKKLAERDLERRKRIRSSREVLRKSKKEHERMAADLACRGYSVRDVMQRSGVNETIAKLIVSGDLPS